MGYRNIPIGNNYPDMIHAIVEIPMESHEKYEYDEQLDVIRLDRILHSPLFYPVNYGFIPETRSEDGDHLDVLILMTEPLLSGVVVNVRPIGALDMADQAGQDWKIVAVAENDPRQKSISSIKDVDEHYKKEIQHFFEVYKHLENKWVEVRGWHDKDFAQKIIIESYKRFLKEDRKDPHV